MGDDIVQMSMRIFLRVMKVVVPVLWRTGLIFPMILGLIQNAVGPENFPLWLLLPANILCGYLITQSLLRLARKDRSLKLWKVVLGRTQSRKELLATNPKADNSLLFSEPTGLVFGRQGRQWCCLSERSEGHCLVLGGPGSGKSACIGIPGLLTYGTKDGDEATVFAIDIKGELQQKTRHRRPKSKVFSLTLPNSCGYNPFYQIDGSKNLVEQIKGISECLIEIPADTKDPFWKNSARSYLTACLLWAWGVGCPFAEIMRLIQITPPQDMIAGICGSDDETALLYANQFRGMPEQTLASIYGEVALATIPFSSDEELIAALKKPKEDCISPADLDNGISLYIHLSEHRIEGLRGFLTLLVNQFLRHFEKRPDGESTRVLFLLDEFARLGKLPAILGALGTLRSKKVNIVMMLQSMGQLEATYGQAQRKIIADNCSYWAILRVSDPESQQYISKAIGTYERNKQTYSDNMQDLKMTGSKGISRTTEDKPVIKPELLNQLRDDLLLITPSGFCRIRKAYYFKEPIFQKLLRQP